MKKLFLLILFGLTSGAWCDSRSGGMGALTIYKTQITSALATSTGSMTISMEDGLYWQDTSTGTGVWFVMGSTINIVEMKAYALTAPTALSFVSIADQNGYMLGGSSLTFNASAAYTNVVSCPTVPLSIIAKDKRVFLHNQAVDGKGISIYIKYWKVTGQ